MSRIEWTPEQIQWMRENYPVLRGDDLDDAYAARFGHRRSHSSLQMMAHRYGLQAGPLWNEGPMYSEGLRQLGGKQGGPPLLMIKVPGPDGSPVMVPKKRWVWERHHGPIPERHVILQVDGDVHNCEIGNLECVSRSVYQRIKSQGARSSDGEELYRAGIALGRLRQAIVEAQASDSS